MSRSGSSNRTVPVVEPDSKAEESSESSDFDTRQERINNAHLGKPKEKKLAKNVRTSWRGHEDSVLDKVRRTKEGFFKQEKTETPDSARNLVDPHQQDSTRDAFQLNDGTQDAINMNDLKD